MEYRTASNALLAEEIELRRHIERVAAQRRALPLGGEIPENYVFTRTNGKIHHSWSDEMSPETADPAQDPRGAPDIDPLGPSST